MPASQLFVDSEDDFEDFEGGDSAEEDDDSDGEHPLGNGKGNSDEGEGDGEEKGKKRKGANKRNEARRNKKLKKLGPKLAKGGKKDTLTKEEIKELTAKEYTQFSNLYEVQLEEVLKECVVPEATKERVTEWVDNFKGFILGQKKSKKVAVEQYPVLLKEVQLPLQKKIYWDAENGKMFDWMESQVIQWKPPASVEVRGSWQLDTQLESVSGVDVFLEMPSDFLLKSDYLNHKYHVKRAIYLGIVAKKLMARGEEAMLEFTLAGGDPLKPVVCVYVSGVPVMIRAVPPRDFFKLSKLACDKNNLRYEHFFRKAPPQDEPETSTQHYNFTILEDSLAEEINSEIDNFLSHRPKFRAVVRLVKIWLAQRGLLQGYGGFSGFLISQFIYYLFHMNRIREDMSTLQILRVFLVNLVQEDLSEKGIGFCDQSDSIKFAQLQWDLVFLDRTGLLNFTASISKITYRRIQEEAKHALIIIDKRNVTGFLALFTTKVKFLVNFDHIIRLSPRRLEKNFQDKFEYHASFLDHSGYVYPLAVSTIGGLIEKCLGKRITMLDCQLVEPLIWSPLCAVPAHFPCWIHFGININREASQRLIERCESENHLEIEEFKKFWGNKSELRRFKDGTLQECVALENISLLGKARLCYQMLHYIFQQHLNYTMGENAYIDNQVENMVESRYVCVKTTIEQEPNVGKGKKESEKKIYLKGKLAKKKMKKLGVLVTEERERVSVDEVTKQASTSFDELSKILRQLDELPLQISTVQATSAVLRFTHVQPTPPQTFFTNQTLTILDSKRKALLIKRDGSELDFKKKGKKKTKNVTNGDAVHDTQVSQETKSDPQSLPPKLPKYVEPVGVIIHLESSGQWPDDMQAIERLKCAFLIKIGQLLNSKFGLTTQPYATHLDVLKDGFVFRITITYFRELTLLRELRGADGVLRKRDNQESLRLERESLILPQLTSTLHNFHLQYESFGKTCRLVKRWLASQLLLASPWQYNRNLEEPDCRFTEECVELLVAYVFLNHAPYLRVPSEAQVGLQRFLYLLSKTDFHAVPIIINFNDKWTVDEVSAIELEFVKIRTTLPSIFIATPFDPKGSVWTRNLLGVLLKRAKRLADVTLTIMESQFDSERMIQNYSNLVVIFAPLTRDLDVLIHLKDKMNARSFQFLENLDKPLIFKPYKKKAEEVVPVTDFDPVQVYLQQLRDAFGHLAVFLHDTYGGNFIAIKWKADIFKSTAFTTSSVKGRCLRKSNLLTTNISGVLESFEVMGHGLVTHVEAFPDRWEINQ